MTKKALMGLFFALAAAAVGFVWGRHAKAEALRRAVVAPTLPVRAPAPAQPSEPEPSLLPESPSSLPSDPGRGSSIPKGLK